MKRIICLFLAVVFVFLLTACSNKPADNGGVSNNSSNNNNNNANSKEKYANIQTIMAAYDDVYIYKNYNGTYGLLSTDGDILHEGFALYQTFSEFSNYISCYDGSTAMNPRVSSILDKKGNTVLSVGKNNIEFISVITQGRILAYRMTEETPSGKIYDLICYSAKDMSEIFRVSGLTSIDYYASFDEDGYVCVDDYYGRNEFYDLLYIDIYGNRYNYAYQNRLYVSEKSGQQLKELPMVSGIEPIIDTYAWRDLIMSYSEYENSPYNTRDFEIGTTKNSLGEIATLYMKNTSEWCATMDKDGNILMPPTKDIMLKYEYYNWGTITQLYTFSNDLCCAYQPSSGLWGYVDPYGNWKVAPKYKSVTTFSYAGLAVVENLIVIDTTGKIVLDISDRGDIHPLEGEYELSTSYDSYWSYSLTFSKDGILVSESTGLSTTGAYEIHGNSLIVSDMGYSSALSNGVHTFEKKGDTLIIEGNIWVLKG
ncbi:MAG: WG repeat-containing protein [Clostridia bacterium]|nr:WG repeat-containing protein [Clostridia bacterium]